MKNLQNFDQELYTTIEEEQNRQLEKLELIASENIVSERVRSVVGSILTNKYAEGYPGKRYYGGCEHVDVSENLAISRAKTIFGADHANVQPHSGSQANMAVYMAELQPGDCVLGMDLAHGGHLTHGSKVNFSGSIYNVQHYGVSTHDQIIDMNQVREKAKKHQPKMIIVGASAYPRFIDFKTFKEIADEVGAVVLVDMAHIAGLIAAGVHDNPVPYAQYVTTTTHKTLRGPRGGMILCQQDYAKKLDSKIFPGIQGGPLCHVIAAKAVAFKEAQSQVFKDYAKQVLANAQSMANALMAKGYKLTTDGTDNHLMLADLTNKNITGKSAQEALDKANITVNRNAVPFDKLSPFVTSGIRLGSPALTSRGMKENDMETVVGFMDQVISNVTDEVKLTKIGQEVKAFASSFPEFDDQF
ncbi:MAG: serine hydroxymethyltransferase [Deltaproteobacteria bacterium]|jgi:glycine hydroxymethyltransferase|nr:serine hydroxymethyltransferase [Deltaproteobacteria bacterium]